jgi:phage terminase small subunit
MARTPKPTRLLELSGTLKDHPGRYANRNTEPKPDQPLGIAPTYMTKEQKKIWKELAGMVVPGVLTKSDRWAVEMAVTLISQLRDGTINGQKMSILTGLLARLGLTPSDRSKVNVVPPKQETKEDGWADFLEDDNEERATQ